MQSDYSLVKIGLKTNKNLLQAQKVVRTTFLKNVASNTISTFVQFKGSEYFRKLVLCIIVSIIQYLLKFFLGFSLGTNSHYTRTWCNPRNSLEDNEDIYSFIQKSLLLFFFQANNEISLPELGVKISRKIKLFHHRHMFVNCR